MNILVINGSPKGSKSNTYRLTQAFLEGLTAGGNAKTATAVETLEISKLNIRPCLGCFSCWNKTPGKCCIHDDMTSVIEKLLWADLTIWSFPLYYYGLPGPLKNLIDRQLPMVLPFMASETESGGHPSRYDTSGKQTVLISTCGFYTAKGNYNSVTAMFDRICGKKSCTTIFCGQGELLHVNELKGRTDEYLSNVRQAGKEYASGGISEETMKKLNENLYPREVFETMADASWGVTETGEKEDDSFIFTRQMAALYNKNAYSGQDIILEMNYTDIGKTYRITLGKEGGQVSKELNGSYTTQINTPYAIWRSIAAGEIAGDEALMKHLYSVEGDFNLMLHWDDYFGMTQDTSKETQKKESEAKTDMARLLIPWIVFWVAAAIDDYTGSLISLAVCLLIPVLMDKTKATVYDKLSCLGVGGCALAMLAGASPMLMIPAAYFLFGLMWCISCFAKIPLTAHYSKNSYNGDAALRNPIFMKTNRILTAVWGILYLLTPIWTCYIMQTDAASYVGAINSVLPALMGLFTAWFEKWYPKHVASGK